MYRLLLLVLVSGLVLAPPVAAEPLDRTDRVFLEEARVSLEESGRDHPFRHLEGTYRVDDRRLRAVFDQAVRVVVQLQAEEVLAQARMDVNLQRRTQRRTPAGARDVNDIEPSHIPAVEMARSPL